MPRKSRARLHDVAYRDLFTHPELIEDLLRHFVKEPWVDELDFSSLQRENEVSVLRRKGVRVRDVVWSVNFRDRQLFILILLEFQSRRDPIMAIRQVLYAVSLYEDLYKQKRFTPSGKLPPVLPIVLYKGQRPWQAPLSIEDMIEQVSEPIARYLPRMSYFFLDELRAEVTITEEERNTVAALLALEQSHLRSEVLEVVCLLVKSMQEPSLESLRQAFKKLLLKALPTEFAPIAEVFDHPEDPMTLYQRHKLSLQKEQAAARKEREAARAEGRQEGRQEGRAEGQRALVRSLLEKKFGQLDEVAAARLANATPAKLSKWALRVLTAGSLEEIWA